MVLNIGRRPTFSDGNDITVVRGVWYFSITIISLWCGTNTAAWVLCYRFYWTSCMALSLSRVYFCRKCMFLRHLTETFMVKSCVPLSLDSSGQKESSPHLVRYFLNDSVIFCLTTVLLVSGKSSYCFHVALGCIFAAWHLCKLWTSLKSRLAVQNLHIDGWEGFLIASLCSVSMCRRLGQPDTCRHQGGIWRVGPSGLHQHEKPLILPIVQILPVRKWMNK